ncbi:hypothetical protein CNY89_00150 [Amaricoccus sp. HAR-UPW-R2A-40]|nr:hypothetical protein CNY89_00150 [Amaricoccus sp. HAR-UPW-R2A-40]
MTPALLLVALSVSTPYNAAVMSCQELADTAVSAYDAAVFGTDLATSDALLNAHGGPAMVDNLARQLREGSPMQRGNAGAALRFIEIFNERGC